MLDTTLKKLFLLLAFGLPPLSGNANQTFWFTLQIGRVCISTETLLKPALFLAAVNKYNRIYTGDTAWIHLHFGYGGREYLDDTTRPPLTYGLGYELDSFYLPGHGYERRHARMALHFYCADPSFKISNCLRIIDYGLHHKKEVIQLQRERLMENYRFGDSLIKTVDETSLIQMAIRSNVGRVSKLLTNKIIYPAGGWYNSSSSWYIQQDSFCFNDPQIPMNTLKKPLLTIPDLRAVWSKDSAYLVYTNDSIVYCILAAAQQVYGPYRIPLLLPDATPLGSYARHRWEGTQQYLSIPVDWHGGEYLANIDTVTGRVTVDLSTPDSAYKTELTVALFHKYLLRPITVTIKQPTDALVILVLISMLLLWSCIAVEWLKQQFI